MTRSSSLPCALVCALLAVTQAQAAESAGRVLAAVGDTFAVRAGRDVTLAVGAPVEKGDTLKVGERSNLQVRFSDDSVLALRPNTLFRIDDFQFENKPGEDKSLFSLLKGGMRTITGIIGRASRRNYAVQAPTATIGIRGTHFTLVSCNNDCRNTDGSLAPNGTFGGVTEGKVVARNQAGEREFAKDQFFHVATASSLPQTLLTPPAFLRDRLEGAARSRGRSSGQAEQANSGEDGGAGGSRTAAFPALPALPPEPYNAAGRAATDLAWDWAAAYSIAADGYSSTWSQQRSHKVTAGDYQTGDDIWISYAYLSNLSLLDLNLQAWAHSASYSDSFGGWSGTYRFQKSAAIDLGSDAEAGNVHWGRHYEVETFTNNRVSDTSSQWVHWTIGDPVIALPTSGVVAYSWIGGTRPTDFAGNVGSALNGGEVSVNFSSNTMSTVRPITWTMPGNINYSVGFSNQSFTYSYPPLTAGVYNKVSSYASIDATATSSCTGNCSLQSATVNPAFMGSRASGLGLGIATSATLGETGTQDTASAQVYKRATTPTPR